MDAWSLVDYLLRAGPGTLGPFEYDAAWKAWVQVTYSPRKRPR